MAASVPGVGIDELAAVARIDDFFPVAAINHFAPVVGINHFASVAGIDELTPVAGTDEFAPVAPAVGDGGLSPAHRASVTARPTGFPLPGRRRSGRPP